MNAKAPYNFIPLSTHVPVRYESIQDLPSHDRQYPDLKSGRIFVEITADSPIFISDGNKEKPQFPKDSKGRYQIPASSLRGAIRSTAEILGCGLFRKGEHFQDVQIYFRDVASSGSSVSKDLKEYYKNVLDVKSERSQSDKPFSIPRAVQSGHLRREGANYYLAPTQSPFLRVSRKLLAFSGFTNLEANSKKVAFSHDGKVVKSIVPLRQKTGQMEEGVLLCTGKSVGDKENSLYVFPLPKQSDEIILPAEDVVAYQEDWETRQNVLGMNRDFWALPKDGESKPVFFVRHNAHYYFGMSLFLRIGHKFPLSQGLSKEHREANEENSLVLDYPYALFGFATGDVAYRSRVTFSACTAQGKVKPMPATSAILAGPKPSYYPGYVHEGKHYSRSAEKDSQQAGFKLRGTKQYWLKEENIPSVPLSKQKVATQLSPLPKGTSFRGIVHFSNLHPDELGLLLWSLRLNPNCYHSLGMGKPFGLGRCALKITKLEVDSLDCYTPQGLCQQPEPSTDQVQHYIHCYEDYVAEHFILQGKSTGKKPSQLATIQNFFYLRSVLQQSEDVNYMELDQYKKTRNPLPTIKEWRESVENAESAAALDPLAKLLEKFGPSHLR